MIPAGRRRKAAARTPGERNEGGNGGALGARTLVCRRQRSVRNRIPRRCVRMDGRFLPAERVSVCWTELLGGKAAYDWNLPRCVAICQRFPQGS